MKFLPQGLALLPLASLEKGKGSIVFTHLFTHYAADLIPS